VGQLTMASITVNVPYFGDGMETTLRCGACGFRHADFMILSQKEPLRLEFRAETPEDLTVRVIRSNSGTIRIPELGFTAEPSPLSESYVSNMEGVLDRAKDILLTALEFNGDDPAKVALLQDYLSRYERMIGGHMPFSLVIDDPFGNSAILSDRVQRRALTPEEVETLKTGMVILNRTDLA
jgi:zinc finger protein